MFRCSSIATIVLLLIVITGIACADETDIPSDWADVDDSGDWLWLKEINPFDWKHASRLTIASTPEFYPGEVDSIIKQLPTRLAFLDSVTSAGFTVLPPENISPGNPNKKHFSLKLTTITGRKYGETTDDNLDRYDGNPLSSTNRFALTIDNFDCGLTLDKDAFEPHYTDLSRFWARWKNENSSVVLGDFHITIGRGLAVWTKPDYRSAFDNAASFRPSSAIVRSAGDSFTNSALRGAAFQFRTMRTSLTLFGAHTELDAISAKDSTGLMLRLSDTGLHRTIGEEGKKNLVTESAYGGVVSHEVFRGSKRSLELFLGGYAAEYDPGFSGETSPRIRFPLIGSHLGAFSSGVHYAGRRISSFGEIGSDLTGRIAWSIAGSASLPVSDIGVDGVIFSTPKGFQSPRSRDPFEGTLVTGCEGAAVHVKGNPRDSMVDYWRAHLEIMHVPWRSYTVPMPSIRSRFSLEGGLKFSDIVRLEMRYRQRQSDDGHGEEAAVEQYTDQRLRARLHFDVPSVGRQTVWVEGITRTSNLLQPGRGFGCGIKQHISANISKRQNTSVSETISLAYFSTANGAVEYYGEAGVPGRIRVVALSGEGIRWSGVAGLELGKITRIYLQAAQTIRIDRMSVPQDMEIWAGLSYYIRKLGYE